MQGVNKELANIKLPSPPAIAVRILEAVKKENTSSDELSKIITADPALTYKVLRAANSPIYAIPSKVDTIQRAITVLGFNALKNIALSFVIATELKADSVDSFDFDYFWKSVTFNLLNCITLMFERVCKIKHYRFCRNVSFPSYLSKCKAIL